MNKNNKPSWDLSPRQLCDIEMLLSGAFAPLKGFLNQADYDSVLATLRLADGNLWPMPITLDVSARFAESLQLGETLELRDPEGVLIATLQLESIWTPNKDLEALKVFGSNDPLHPGVYYLHHQAGAIYLGGTLTAVELPEHYDYRQHRHTPAELKALFKKLGWHKVVAFQTRNPMHRAHQELTFRAARELEANLLIHPVVGMTKPGDIDHFTRVRCYEQLIKHYPEQTTFLSLLHLAMRMAGPREAVWHALIRKNYGCTHFIIGRDHAGPGKNSQGQDFYEPYAAQALAKEFEAEMGIKIVSFENVVYVQDRAEYLLESEVAPNEAVLTISGTEFRRRLREGLEIPTWFSYPEVITELRRSYPPRHQQGFTVFFTGLSGSGKSTVANALMVKLMEMGGRPVTLLDGDVVRKNLSSELSFSKEHRDLNIRRIGYVASEITKNGGIAICAPIAPYSAVRREVRELVENYGGFIEIHVATPLAECERRDRKGLYAKARSGLLKGFTGIDDPYEAPERPELKLDTSEVTPDECAHKILLTLERLGFIKY
ncbi:sulfate adenylyltransferase [Thiothrix eikelboomii]|uniref:Adenylyl-sulfate kinase n=1 Tax=Thiothrix eikelboomii TaxID=92487 RepID=A0A1T4XJ90_9GAMM|nr:bifunctional sulfate adenylyltransferase/adenylylsulfate kinase [Thiothrix eikelboomii]SKA89584.1 sulfate adenylyltransferase [Thiothrix eikelboomii]